MCFAYEIPTTFYDIVHKVEECMTTLDEMADLHPESHYLILSNELMKIYHIAKRHETEPTNITIDDINKVYDKMNDIENNQIKIGLVKTRKHDVEGFTRLNDGILEVIDLKLFVDDDEEIIEMPDGLDADKHFCDSCGNVYKLDIPHSKYGKYQGISTTPVGFFDASLFLYIPVPKQFYEELDWNTQIDIVYYMDAN